MKQIEVVAAIICKEGTYLAAHEGMVNLKVYGNFPVGKIEPGEFLKKLYSRDQGRVKH
jgi:hypothetical protein